MKTCGKCQLLKSHDDFDVNRRKRDGLQSYCRPCKAQYFQDNRERLLPKIRAASKITKDEVRLFVDSYKVSHPCERCGESDTCVLDFHHPHGTKEFSIADSNTKGRPLSKVKEEIGKCHVLCSNCHRKFHAGRFALEAR